MMQQGYRIAILAGERSGDQLGGALCAALAKLLPGVQFEGVGGEAMAASGCQLLAHVNELSVMGLVEVAAHLPRLFSLRRRLLRHWKARPPDCFIGIDAPDFNLPIARRLKRLGVPTAQYVAPTAWAWREGRAARLHDAVDKLLVLFPFEEVFFSKYVPTRFVGHPLAARPPAATSDSAARAILQLSTRPVLAILPGSRWAEIRRMAPVFLQAATWLNQQQAWRAQLLLPVAREDFVPFLQRLADDQGLAVRFLPAGQAALALQAADAALITCGTATLEAALAGCPFVTGYRLSPWSYLFLKATGMVRTPFFALPNILLGQKVVPEFIQPRRDAGPALGKALQEVLRHADAIRAQFGGLRTALQGKPEVAAHEVLAMLQQRGGQTSASSP